MDFIETPPEFGPEELVCFCFGHTRREIEADYLEHGRSLITEEIAASKRQGGCDCALKNPKGR